MRALGIALVVVAVGCTFDTSGEGTGPDEDFGADAGLAEVDDEPSLLGLQVESVAPPAEVVCIDDDGDGFTIVPECGGSMDCNDGDGQTHPSQLEFFAAPNLAGNYDYDCNGAEAKQDSEIYEQTTFTCDSGWDNVVPTCGQQASWMGCDYGFNFETQKFECSCNASTRSQFCR